MGPNVSIYDVPQNASLEKYCEAKLEILGRDFKITLTEEEIAYAHTLKTEIQIEQFCLGIIDKRWS